MAMLGTAASLAGTTMLVRGLIKEFKNLVPVKVQGYINNLLARFFSELTMVIEETDGISINEMYVASKTYLATKISSSTRKIKVSKLDDSKRFKISIEPGEELFDVFEGARFKWVLVVSKVKSNTPDGRTTELRWFNLSFNNKHREKVFGAYLPYVLNRAQAIKEEDKTLKLYVNKSEFWRTTILNHPATFDTLAMDSEAKQALMEDLTRFLKRKDYYKRIGKAWKRGYLLYGPPGTGKSSLIAAMANYINFDIYNLELTSVYDNYYLQRLLASARNRSIIVVEDIDCSIKLENRDTYKVSKDSSSTDEDKVTLAGLLNSVDGLFSSHRDERIIVFTTNHKDRLDPALIRPGRMDVHIYMGYCNPEGFKILASNYHAIEDHRLFGEIEGLIQQVEVTPGQVAEELLRSEDIEIALEGLVKFLKGKKGNAKTEEDAKTEEMGLEDEAVRNKETGAVT